MKIYRYKEAINVFEDFLDLYKDSVFVSTAREELGEIYYKFREYEKAYQHLHVNVINCSSHTYVDSAMVLIDVYFAWGKMDEAYKLIQEGLTKYNKDNQDIDNFYLKFRGKLAEYYFIKRDWDRFKSVNRIPILKWFFWRNSELASTLQKLNYIYKYRDDDIIINAYTNYHLAKHKETLDILSNVDLDKVDKKLKFVILTMKGVSYYHLNQKERAIKYLLKANTEQNILFDENAYYLSLINYKNDNLKEAAKYIDIFFSIKKSDLWYEGVILAGNIKVKLERFDIMRQV